MNDVTELKMSIEAKKPNKLCAEKTKDNQKMSKEEPNDISKIWEEPQSGQVEEANIADELSEAHIIHKSVKRNNAIAVKQKRLVARKKEASTLTENALKSRKRKRKRRAWQLDTESMAHAGIIVEVPRKGNQKK